MTGPATKPAKPVPGNGTDRAARLGAIDIGTNSIRLIVADVSTHGAYRIVDDEKLVTRLGRGSGRSRALNQQAIAESAEAAGRLAGIARGLGVDHLRVVATAAVRDASNRDTAVAAIEAATASSVEVISAHEEARLAYRSVAASFDLSTTDVAVADIGGGSTEVVVSIQGVIEHIYTLPLGAVRLKDRFGSCDDPAGEQLDTLRDHVRTIVRDYVDRPANAPQMLVGTGGTFTTLAAMSMHQAAGDGGAELLPGALRDHEIQRDEIRHLTEAIRRMPLDQRTAIQGLPSDRADIIVPGLVIIDRLMKRLGVNRLLVHDRGIRDGILLEMIDTLGLPGRPDEDRARGADSIDASGSAIEFAARCGIAEPGAKHTAALALSILEQLDTLGWLPADEADARILEAAAILRDVGYLVNYSKHHKHSYHLILHADLPGLSAQERLLVATVARYHRKAKPSLSHPEFASLGQTDRQRVRGLAAILRVADGLERTHAQDITAVRIEVRPDRLVFQCDAAKNPEICLWGASRRSELFEDVFGRPVEFVWKPTQAAANGEPHP
ncbi:MAG: Ppx/GppA phosphatase family protein [Planctomycetota bacterium]